MVLVAATIPASLRYHSSILTFEFVPTIAPSIRAGRRVLIAAHGNSLRALVKYLDGISDAEIVGLNIPTGVPLVYELDAALKPLGHRYLGNADDVAQRIATVSTQGKAKA